jgi:GTP-binding protein YchF
MKCRVGILGLPNIGKSTLFNALNKKSVARAENFPFCTIDPNLAPIVVPDDYLQALGTFAGSSKQIPATMEWVDVAGLAKGAHRGEGLENFFLATLRECDAICHLVRMFEDKNIIHVEGKVNPAADAEVVNLELALADLAHVERRLEKTNCGGQERATLTKVVDGLKQGVPARAIGLSRVEAFSIKSMGLLTLKPVLYAFNVDEVDFLLDREEASKRAAEIVESIQYFDPSTDMFTLVSANMEAQVSKRDGKEREEYLSLLGVELEPTFDSLLSYNALPSLICKLLDLSVVYTGPGIPPERSRTTKAYLFSNNSWTADDLAGRLHGDIRKGFIRAEVASVELLLEHASYTAAKEAGCIRTEGRDYVLNSHDVVLIKWK